MPSPLDRVRDVLGIDLNEVPGASVSADIPIPDGVINRFIARGLALSQAPVAAVRVESADGDRLLAHVTVRGPRFIPEITVAVAIDRQPQFPQSPVLWLRWSLPRLGAIAAIAAPLLSNMKNLPRGVRVEGDRASVDVAEMLRARSLGDLLPLLTNVQVGTLSGKVVLRVELRT
jgi:hypothetical protein